MQFVNGICGWSGRPGRESPDDEASLRTMLAALGDEGGEPGSWLGEGRALGSTRTSLVESGGWRAAFAGRPRAPGGMEAWLERFSREGPAALASLEGSFSIAVLEPDGGVLLAGDRVGACPLWFQRAGSGIAFASDPRCLDRVDPDGAEPDPQALYHYLYFGMVPGPGSARRGRSRLRPGEFVRLEDGELAGGRYWSLAFDTSAPPSEAELREVLRESVRRAVDGADRVGAFLSGGIDSSTVVGLLAELHPGDCSCYTIAFDEEGYNEIGFAETAARHFGARHRHYTVTADDVLDAIPRIAEAYGEPFGNESAVPTYFCARLAREDGIDCLLAGDGGDELFGGNARYAEQKIFGAYGHLPRLLRSVLEPAVMRFPAGDRIWPVRKARGYIRQANMPLLERMERYNHVERTGVEAMFDPEFLGRVDRGGPLALRREEWDRSEGADPLNRMLHHDMKFTLADNDLRKVTRMCEIAGIDVRYPLLSDALVALSARVPPDLKVKGLKIRHFFKRAMRDFLPHDTLTKTKHGFGLPFGLWLRTHAPLQEFARRNLDALKERRILQPAYIDRVVEAHRSEHAVYYGVAIWHMLMLEQWFQVHVDGRVPQGIR